MSIFRRQRPVTAYWWNAVPNFGDQLTPYLWKHFADLDVDWSPIEDADYVGVGSVLEHIPRGWEGIVLGAGKLHENRVVHLDDARVLALRGPLSAKGVKGDFALGDLGLLANELVEVETKRYELGIVPHWSDLTLEHNPAFTRYPHVVIRPTGDPLDVVRTIGECKKIVSSSLHGIILADAFGTPRRLEYTPTLDYEGALFKFRDYSQSIQTPLIVGRTIEAHRFSVDDRKFELYDALRSIR